MVIKKATEPRPPKAVPGGFDYRPEPQKWLGEHMPLFSDPNQEKAYENWRQDMIFMIYGPQNQPVSRQRVFA
jgi:hypothetical protein